MNIFYLLFSFKGRITRSQYWLASLVNFTLAFLAACVIILASGHSMPDKATILAMDVTVLLGAIAKIMGAVLVVCAISAFSTAAIMAKRLHDRGKSAVWLLAMLFTSLGSAVFWPLFLVTVLGMIWFQVELGFFPGTSGPNQYDGDQSLSNSERGKTGGAPSKAMASALGSIEAAAKAHRYSVHDTANSGGWQASPSRPTSGMSYPHGSAPAFGRKRLS